MTKREEVRNRVISADGHTYRVASHYGRPILVGCKTGKGGERVLDLSGRRGREIVRRAALAEIVDSGTELLGMIEDGGLIPAEGLARFRMALRAARWEA